MADYEYLYCIAIHGMLKERINAGYDNYKR
jgi:hypothetical protein